MGVSEGAWRERVLPLKNTTKHSKTKEFKFLKERDLIQAYSSSLSNVQTSQR
jgi:hypothetical protein